MRQESIREILVEKNIKRAFLQKLKNQSREQQYSNNGNSGKDYDFSKMERESNDAVDRRFDSD